MDEPKLYIISTPLGNRDDVTLRALEKLKALNVFFAEDSREFRKLLDLYGIPAGEKKVYSYAKHNMKEATARALEFLQAGEEVGFVCDRGTPAISDPGAMLVREARGEGYEVIPVPGASSLTALLSVCGWVDGPFLFAGFLPIPLGERQKFFAELKTLGIPVCFFESPKRIRETADELKREFPHGRLFVGREMTKMFETYAGFSLADLDPQTLMEKGEYALVLDPGPKIEALASDWQEALSLRLCSDKEWSKRVAEKYEASSTQIYNALQREKDALKKL